MNIAAEKEGLPVLTIAMCTYNRAQFLRFALESLLLQTHSLDTVCVLVVDNASTDDTQKVIAEMGQRFAHFQTVFEGRQGLSHARNAAVAACRSPWLAFLDDDAKAHADWVSVMLDVIRQDVFDCFGGVFLPWHHLGPPPPWFDEKIATNKDTQAFMGLLPEEECPAGGNCVYRMSFFARCGTFSTALGMKGNVPGYGEENALIKRFREEGARVGFVPHMLIDHCVLPYKYTLWWQIKAIIARGRAQYHLVEPQQHVSPMNCLYWYAVAVAKFLLQQGNAARRETAQGALLKCFHRPLHFTGTLYERYWRSRCQK